MSSESLEVKSTGRNAANRRVICGVSEGSRESLKDVIRVVYMNEESVVYAQLQLKNQL